MKYVILTPCGFRQMYAIDDFSKSIKRLEEKPESLILSAHPDVQKEWPDRIGEVPVKKIHHKKDHGKGGDRIVTFAREKLRKEFLKTGIDWSLWLDNDILVPPNIIREFQRIKERGKLWIHAHHPKRQAEESPTTEFRSGISSSFIHRDLLKEIPFFRIDLRDSDLIEEDGVVFGDDQIWKACAISVDRFHRIRKVGKFFDVGHLNEEGKTIKFKEEVLDGETD